MLIAAKLDLILSQGLVISNSMKPVTLGIPAAIATSLDGRDARQADQRRHHQRDHGGTFAPNLDPGLPIRRHALLWVFPLIAEPFPPLKTCQL